MTPCASDQRAARVGVLRMVLYVSLQDITNIRTRTMLSSEARSVVDACTLPSGITSSTNGTCILAVGIVGLEMSVQVLFAIE